MAFDKNNTSTGMKVVIIIFAVVLVASLCLPFFSGCSSSSSPAPSDGSADSGSTSATVSSDNTVAAIQAKYSTMLSSLENRLKDDPTNTTYMVSLANNYMDCATEMNSADDAASNEDAVAAMYQKAVDQYDEYLAAAASDENVLTSSVSSATVDRAICLFYAGDQDQAVADLEEFLDATPDYAMGWYNLGAFYEQLGETDKAKDAYNAAIENDPEDETGVNTYAQFRLMLMQAMEDAAAADATDDAAAVDATDDADDTGDAGIDDGASDTDGTADDAESTAPSTK